jgi:hypothetical protein
VRDARPVRHRRYVIAAFVFGEPPSEVGVLQIAQRQCDAESGKDPAVDNIRRQVDDMQTKSGQHNDVQNDIGEQTENPFQSPGTHQRGASTEAFIAFPLMSRMPGAPQ